ncbi:MAG: glycine cleavage system protein GcvH [Planctomycetota bacterium]|nr:glycine cleavage system protein GcvH [Planctomycetota bacterium]
MRPDDRKYMDSHEWAKLDGDTVLVGITDFAVQELSHGNIDDLVYCDLPELGRMIEQGETFGEIESVKAVADLNAPVGGEIVEVNAAIEDHLEILATDPWKQGWMVRIKPTAKSLEHLLDAEAYEQIVTEAQGA